MFENHGPPFAGEKLEPMKNKNHPGLRMCSRYRAVIFFLLFLIYPGSGLPNSLMKAADEAIKEKNFKKAEFFFQQARKQNVNPFIIDYNLAYIYYRQGKMGDAILKYQNVVQGAPYSVDAYHNLARIYFEMEEYTEAVAILEQCIERVTNNAESHLLLGDICLQLEAYGDADRHYHRSITLEPQKQEGYLALAELYFSLHDEERALDIVQEASFLIPGEREALLEKETEIYRYLGDYLNAVVVWQKRIQIATNASPKELYELDYALAEMYIDGQYPLLAIDVLEKMVDMYPEESDSSKLLGYIYRTTGRYGRALDLYRRIVEKDAKAAYLEAKKLLVRAYNEGEEEWIQKIVSFYDAYGFRDEIYLLTRAR